ncbi:MBL fold metallo-hydrolase, partial [archaeon]|nr:MBL fold metallo-hydrolase [archaeon]
MVFMPASLFEGIYFLEGNKGFDCNSLLIKGNKTALIDPGFGKEKELIGLGLDFDSICLILLTHCHADHFFSASNFKNAEILASKDTALKITEKDASSTASDFFNGTIFPGKISAI